MSAALNSRLKRWPGWLALLFVAVLLVAVGAAREGGVSTPQERAEAIQRRLACPTCDGESVYESRATAAINIRTEIERRVDEGRLSDAQIIGELETVYGEQLLLLPSGSGINVLVWALPAAAAVAGVAGLGLAFHRWRSEARGTAAASAEDRELVAAALAAGDR